jgi:GTPase SAR1 family protein
MASIDNIILKSTNPFDNYRSVNFWQQQKDQNPLVESIHQDAIATIEETLDQVAQDHRTRTLMLQGDPGSGKTYLLGRLKKTLNDKAFFVYIKPFPQSDRIWRHILRYTVDSMVQVPEGQQDSQLMLWLKSLSAFTQRSLKVRIMKDNFWEVLTSDRKKFIKQLKDTYKQAGIYNADNFFGVLHDLTNPELYTSACEWLQGDDLSEESLKELGVKGSIDSEEAACETLANFGRIASETQPIVLCFDQLESIARLPDGSLDLQALFSVNTKIHDENNNFFVIISITTDTWRQNEESY